jgi:AraC-like DNA-binding protein
LLQSRTFAPHEDLAPYIRRHYIFEAELPDGAVIEDSLLSETAFIRVLTRGSWSALSESGEWEDFGPVLLFGGNGRPMRVRIKGAFTVVNFAIRPSGWKALFGQSAQPFADKITPLADVWGATADKLHAALVASKSDKASVAALESAIRAQLDARKINRTDDQMAEFESIARIDSTTKVQDASDRLGMSSRQLERRCLASFGIGPKTVLRRSRFLDMATALRGFSTPSEEELATLRYFDESHLNREFWRFAGMPPGAFTKAISPLLTLGLSLRNEGKSLG